MTDTIKTKSRRRTPWTGADASMPLQAFIDSCTERDYSHRHPALRARGEAEWLNAHEVTACRFCGSGRITKEGCSDNGIRRYGCKDCGRRFNILTNTIFDNHRLPISEWIGFLLDIFGYGSFGLTSKVNRNSSNTTRYWIEKTFMLMEGIQDDVVLEGKVWLDETFIRLRNPDIRRKQDGTEYHGLSRNQMCIGMACDDNHVLLFYEGTGKPSGRRTLELFGDHIRPGSTIVHDSEKAHNGLVSELNLVSEAYDSKEIRRLPDSKNPLNRVNQMCRLVQMFLHSHSGFPRSGIQGYLNMFHVMTNPPDDKYEKIERLLDLGIRKSVLLRYRPENR